MQRDQSRFKEKVIDIVKKIPKGETLSYGEVARLSGKPGASRAVGRILASNKDLNVPCHRVVRADGSLGGYNGLRGSKKDILLEEGFRGKII